MDKHELRSYMKKIRAQMSELEVIAYSRIIEDRLLAEEMYQKADCIYAYIDCKNEVSTRAIISNSLKNGKKVAIPKVEGEDIRFYYIESFSELKKGYQGIYEPETASEKTLANEKNALCIVPGVAFDKKMNRIGYGGGFYDRFFEANPDMIKCALCFDTQLVDEIETEDFDIRMDIIVTPSALLKS